MICQLKSTLPTVLEQAYSTQRTGRHTALQGPVIVVPHPSCTAASAQPPSCAAAAHNPIGLLEHLHPTTLTFDQPGHACPDLLPEIPLPQPNVHATPASPRAHLHHAAIRVCNTVHRLRLRLAPQQLVTPTLHRPYKPPQTAPPLTHRLSFASAARATPLSATAHPAVLRQTQGPARGRLQGREHIDTR